MSCMHNISLYFQDYPYKFSRNVFYSSDPCLNSLSARLTEWLPESVTFLKFPAYEGSHNLNSWPNNLKFGIQLYFMILTRILEFQIMKQLGGESPIKKMLFKWLKSNFFAVYVYRIGGGANHFLHVVKGGAKNYFHSMKPPSDKIFTFIFQYPATVTSHYHCILPNDIITNS